MAKECFISVDVEASGPIPGIYSEHTHNALDDAVEQAIIFEKILSDTNGLKFKK